MRIRAILILNDNQILKNKFRNNIKSALRKKTQKIKTIGKNL